MSVSLSIVLQKSFRLTDHTFSGVGSGGLPPGTPEHWDKSPCPKWTATIRNVLKALPVSLGQLGHLGLGQTIGGWCIGGPYVRFVAGRSPAPGDLPGSRYRRLVGLFGFGLSAFAFNREQHLLLADGSLTRLFVLCRGFAGNAFLQGVLQRSRRWAGLFERAVACLLGHLGIGTSVPNGSDNTQWF
jgi:hypothetical protein